MRAQAFDKRAVLDKPIHPLLIGDDLDPLARAVRSIGRTIDTYVDFGIELDSDEARQPIEGLTLGQAFQRVLAQTPGFDYQVKSPHLISIAPTRLRKDPPDILNVKIASFDVDGVQSGKVPTEPESFIPELRKVMYRSVVGQQAAVHVYMGIDISIGPLVTVHLRDTTVREILDTVSIATEADAMREGLPLGWGFQHGAFRESTARAAVAN